LVVVAVPVGDDADVFVEVETLADGKVVETAFVTIVVDIAIEFFTVAGVVVSSAAVGVAAVAFLHRNPAHTSRLVSILMPCSEVNI